MRSLRLQLLASHLILVVIMGAVMSGAIASFFSLSRAIDRVVEENFRTLTAASEMREAITVQQAAINLFFAGQIEQALAMFDEGSRQFAGGLEAGRKSANDPTEQAELRAIGEAARRFQSVTERFLAEDLESPRVQRAYIEAVAPTLNQLKQGVDQLQQTNQEAIVRDNERAKRQAQLASETSVALTGVALLCAIFLTILISRSLLRPLSRLAEKAKAIGEGKLETALNYRRDDEIGAVAQAFNSMAANLAEARETEHRRLERAERMSDAALEHLYDPVVVTDAKGRIVYLNKAAQGLFGPAPSTPRLPVVEHIGDQRIVRAIKNAVTEDRVSASEDETAMVPVRVGDADRTYRLRASPMKDDEGRMLGSVAVLEDITHLKDLDRLKTEFIGVASHELRTPVTSLLLSVQLLEEGAAGELTEAQRGIVHAQKQDLERLEGLMGELLDITRLEAGTSPPRFELLRPSELVRGATQPMRSQAERKGLSLETQVPEGLPLVRADRSQIARVLTNLVSNAIRHTPSGGRVSVLASATDNKVTFSVEDTGEGIPSEYLSRIFERFTQVPGATQGGAGLGLSIARIIVKAHGGEMWAESELGKGARVSFTLLCETRAATGDRAT